LNILVVEKTYPWPVTSGSHIRVAGIVEALASLGEVDFFHISKAAQLLSQPSHQAVARFAATQRPPSRYGGLRRVAWFTGSRLPLEVAMRDHSVVQSAFRGWARSRYDLAWFGRAENYFALGNLVGAPTVLDLDDLKDHWISGSLQAPKGDNDLLGGGSPSTTLLHRWGWRVQATANARRWRALQRRIVSSVDAVSVCSDLDARRIQVPNAVVIPNGYPAPERPVGRTEVGEPPTLVLPALFRYRPNVDAARFLVGEIFPRVRAHLPQARVRLVGDYDHRIADLAQTEGVTLTGFVQDISAELARADLICVPVRFGGGTRVKILEAFAHRIPVVSTSVGSEGLDVTNREHLLVAERSEDLARACTELLMDVSLRSRMAEAAHDLYRRRYRWEVISSDIVELASRVSSVPALDPVRRSSNADHF
jgi:glycosyltransferase involved in cell wall biosynthesis